MSECSKTRLEHALDVVMSDSRVGELLQRIKVYDVYTWEHSMRVCEVALRIGIGHYLEWDELIQLGKAAAIHDIGKVYIPIELIRKPSKLTAEEFDIVKEHAMHSAVVALSYGFDLAIVFGLAEHHEGYNGYPFGIEFSKLSVISQIIKIADIYDAITVKRVYNNKALSKAEAIEVLSEMGEIGEDLICELNCFVDISPGGRDVGGYYESNYAT